MKLFDYILKKCLKTKEVGSQQDKSWRDYTYISDYLKEKYLRPESDQYYAWKGKYDIAVENNDIKAIKMLTKDKDIHLDTVGIINFIDFFTLSEQSQSDLGSFDEKVNELISLGYAKDVNMLDKDRIIICTNDGDIKVRRLSSVKDFHDKTIETLQRKKRCHTESIKLSLTLRNDNNVCTGWVFNLSSYAKYLHSWVEFTDEKNSEWCLDFTFNSAIDKSSYYRLFNVNNPSKISSAVIEQEFDTIQDMTNMQGVFLKAYLCNREETLEIYDKIKTEHNNGKLTSLERI